MIEITESFADMTEDWAPAVDDDVARGTRLYWTAASIVIACAVCACWIAFSSVHIGEVVEDLTAKLGTVGKDAAADGR